MGLRHWGVPRDQDARGEGAVGGGWPAPGADGQDLHRDPMEQSAQSPLVWKEGRLVALFQQAVLAAPEVGKTGNLWLLATEGKLLPHQQTCVCRV